MLAGTQRNPHSRQSEVESGVQGLTKVELSQAECKSLLPLAKKKAVDAIVALMVTDIINASVSLEQAQVVVSAIELAITLSNPNLIPQETP